MHTYVSVHVCALVFCFSPFQPPPQGGSPECEPSDRTNQVLNGLPCTCVAFLQEASPWHLREEPLSGRLVQGWLVWVSECGACLGAPGRYPCRRRGAGPELPGGDQCGDCPLLLMAPRGPCAALALNIMTSAGLTEVTSCPGSAPKEGHRAAVRMRAPV